MSTTPVLRGDWFQPGQHIDLIGAYRPDMREVDDQALLQSSVFVDSYATTLDHIGELKIPLADGVITPEHVRQIIISRMISNAAPTMKSHCLKTGAVPIWI